MTLLLQLDRIACIRGDRLLFEGLSLALARGEALWLRGPNGAGKSSLIRVAAGLLRAAAGTVTRHERCALIDEAAALDAELPLRRALDVWARIDGIDGPMTQRAMEAMALGALAEVPVSMLSTGQRKRAAMARVIGSAALANSAKSLIVLSTSTGVMLPSAETMVGPSPVIARAASIDPSSDEARKRVAACSKLIPSAIMRLPLAVSRVSSSCSAALCPRVSSSP